MAITGLLLAVGRQITAWADAPAVRQGQSDASPQLALDSILTILMNDGQGIPT